MLTTVIKTSSTISQNIIRNYARKSGRKRIANPGIQKRINILEEPDENNLQNIDVEELESDFMNLGETHREHEKEQKLHREKEKYWIVKQKYFKETQLNFLTWNDKEQIRYLHQTNPSEWTVEKLSEGFPGLPDTISKIIKSKWHKSDAKRENHDKAVENNWKLLKEGKIDLPEILAKHLMKFTSRKPNQHNSFQGKQYKIVHTPQKKGEFSSIIDSYQQLKSKSSNTVEKLEQPTEDVKDLNSIGNSPYGNRMVPLRYIKQPEIKAENTDTHVNVELDKIFHGANASKNKYLTKTTNEVSTKKSLVVQYPEKITIPKDKYKKGFTYKVNDCYYDDDGEFLYRVPGMY